jgi:hypothetical protein
MILHLLEKKVVFIVQPQLSNIKVDCYVSDNANFRTISKSDNFDFFFFQNPILVDEDLPPENNQYDKVDDNMFSENGSQICESILSCSLCLQFFKFSLKTFFQRIDGSFPNANGNQTAIYEDTSSPLS